MRVVTAIFAIKAFRKQAREVTDQASMLKVQSGQLDAQRQQLADQQKINAQQTKVLELQARELGEWIDERKRDADDQRRSRAALVYATTRLITRGPQPTGVGYVDREPGVDLIIHNTGSQPIYDVRVHWVDAGKGSQTGSDDVLGTLPPGDTHTVGHDLPGGTTAGDFIPVVYFRDAAGLGWTLLADGQLGEVDPAAPPGAPVIAITAVMRARGQL